MPYSSRIREIVGELIPTMDEALVAGANLVKESADRKLQSHKLTGELERQTHVDDRQRAGVYVVAGDPKDPSFAFWGSFLEHGTSHAPAYPFLVPSLEENREEIVARVAAAIRGVVE